MLICHRCCIVVILAGFALSAPTICLAQKTEKTEKAGRPAAIAKPTGTSIDDTLVPEVNLQNTKLEELIDFLQAAVPSFKAVVIRDEGVGEESPVIRLRLKKV